MARPRFIPTQDQRAAVKLMAIERIAQVEIAKRIGLAATTLRHYFADELAEGARTPGRPAFAPTENQREQVEILVAARVKQESIAKYLGIDPTTLQVHLRDEIDNGYSRRNCAMLVELYRLGLAGNVTAQRLWISTYGLLPEPPPTSAFTPTDTQTEPRPIPLGKKAAARLAANAAGQGTEWGDDLAVPTTRPN